MKIDDATIVRLQEVFEPYEQIQAVYLFGSHAEGRAGRESDLDLGIVPASGSDVRSIKLDLLADLARAGFDNVDLAFLNGDNLVLEHEAVRCNRVLFSRPDFDHGSFYSRVVRMYLDFLPLLKVQQLALKERLLHG